MASSPPGSQMRSLDQVEVGELVRLDCILFDRVRTTCSAAGMAEGDSVRLQQNGEDFLVVETLDGREVRLDHEMARFIEVTSASGQRYRKPPLA
jgi:hypothetical protein